MDYFQLWFFKHCANISFHLKVFVSSKESEHLSCSTNYLIAMRKQEFCTYCLKMMRPSFYCDYCDSCDMQYLKEIAWYWSISSVPQCVKCPFFVQKLQILGKLEKWAIFISVSKVTIFIGKKIQNISIFVPKLVKNCQFMVLFRQF